MNRYLPTGYSARYFFGKRSLSSYLASSYVTGQAKLSSKIKMEKMIATPGRSSSVLAKIVRSY